MKHSAAWLASVSVCILAGCGGGSGTSSPPPAADFVLSVAPASLTVTEGSSSGPAMVSVTPANGFTGTVSVAIMGLPAGATMNPLSPLTVSAGSSQSFTVATTSSTPTGTVALTLHATSGSLAHDVPASLTINPVIQTMQNGTLLFLQSQANGHTARIGLDTKWGGAIVEISLDGTNFVNAHDTGREVQPALYDATAQYPQTDCALYGWDPVLAGDIYDHGSAVLGQTIAAESLYTKTIPIQWCPERFGGGPSMAEPADMIFEQTVTLAPGAALAFQVHYKLTHTGSDTHYNNGQEFPAVYVNSVYTTFARYGDTNPWNYGTITQTLAPLSTPAAPNGPLVYAPEQWAALVDGNNQGLTVYVPGVYPFWTATSFPQSGGSGPTGDATVYMAPMTIMSVAPGAVIEGDIYLVPGDATAARSVVYGLHQALAPSNIVAPLGNVDLPAANASISGASVQVAGWAFGRQTVTAVTIFVDGSLMGATTLGGARPDVEAAYPNLAPADSGWTYSLDTTSLANGVHSLVVHATDSSGNEALLLPVAVVVSN